MVLLKKDPEGYLVPKKVIQYDFDPVLMGFFKKNFKNRIIYILNF